MSKAKRGTEISRRRALALGAGAAGAAWLAPSVLGWHEAFAAETPGSLAPATGVLKARGIAGRTVNVHTHVLGNPSGGAIPAPSVAPFLPAAARSEPSVVQSLAVSSATK